MGFFYPPAVPPSNTIVAIVSADDPRVAEARMLLLEYTESLDVDLSFQNVDQELSEFPGSYMPPTGVLLLASRGGKIAGSVAMRKLDAAACEMKRLYVRPDSRGLGVGRALAVAVIAADLLRGLDALTVAPPVRAAQC
ncbi:MAG: GNAT family N-acetyltransferase [Gammaproteobacteria bacterium]